MLFGAEITVSIKRPSGTVSCRLPVEETDWSDLDQIPRREVVMRTIEIAGLKCLNAMLEREQES